MPAFTCTKKVVLIGTFITGSINTLSKKAQNDFIVQGFDSSPHSFKHPWFQTWMMSLAMSMSVIGLLFQRQRERHAYREQLLKTEVGTAQPKIEAGPPVQARIFQKILFIPACTSIVANTLLGIGLLYIDASVFVMLRGSVIISTGILSKLFLKRDLTAAHWLGMLTVVIGLVLTGCAGVLRNQQHMTNGGRTLLGITAVLVSQVVYGSQLIFEEKVMKKRDLHPLHAGGVKGFYAFLLMTFIILPVLYFIPGEGAHNSFENTLDALYQAYNNWRLLLLCLLYIASIALYNYCVFAVTKSLSAIHRALIDSCRTVLVWGFSLVIYYAFDKNFGEPFDKSYGLLQVDGFLFQVAGTAMYYNLIDLDNFKAFCAFKPGRVIDQHDHKRPDNLQKDIVASGDETISAEWNNDIDDRTKLLGESR